MNNLKLSKKNFGAESIHLAKTLLEKGGLINKKEMNFITTGKAKLAILIFFYRYCWNLYKSKDKVCFSKIN